MSKGRDHKKLSQGGSQMSNLNPGILRKMAENSKSVVATAFFKVVAETNQVIYDWEKQVVSVVCPDNRRYEMPSSTFQEILYKMGKPYYSGPSQADLVMDLLALNIDVTILRVDLFTEFYIRTLVDQALARSKHAGELNQIKNMQ